MPELALTHLREAMRCYDGQAAAEAAREAVRSGTDPLAALEVLTEAIRDIGERFGTGELWLPDLVGAADTMQSAVPILEEALQARNVQRETCGIVVIGTVLGDIHDIGKGMVATLLTAASFIVHDLGVDLSADAFIAGVKKHDADILAMSALLTTTAPEMKRVIETLEKDGLRKKVKVMVGGAAVTQGFAQKIGADGYSSTAPGAVKLAKSLLNKG